MSYDFRLFELPDHMDLDSFLEMREQQVLDNFTPAPVEGRNESIITALVAKNPRLKALTHDTHTDLDEGAEGNGITVSLYADEAFVSVPYWHSGTAARAVFEEMWGYLEIIQRLSGYVVYDSQKGDLLSLETDFEGVLAFYGGVVVRFKPRA